VHVGVQRHAKDVAIGRLASLAGACGDGGEECRQVAFAGAIDDRGDLGVRDAPGEHGAESGGVRFGKGDEGVDRRGDLVASAQVRVGAERQAKALAGSLEHRDHEGVLVVEVVIEQPARDPGVAGDRVDGDRVGSVRPEQLDARPKELLAPRIDGKTSSRLRA
jgi:hypothetical protein